MTLVAETYDLTKSPHDDRGKRWPPVVVERHLGPGDHPSGSPQDVHAGDDDLSWVDGLADRLETEQGRREFRERMEPYIQKAIERARSGISEEFDVRFAERIEPAAFVNNVGDFLVAPNGEMFNILSNDHDEMVDEILQDVPWEIVSSVADIGTLKKLSLTLGFVRGRSFTPDRDNPNERNLHGELMLEAEPPISSSAKRSMRDVMAVMPEDTSFVFEVNARRDTGFEVFYNVDDIEAYLRRYELDERHLGPGDHPSGSSQDAHAGDGASVREIATRVLKDEWDVVDNVFEIEPGFNGWVLPDGTVIDIHNETHLNSLEQIRYHVKGWDNEPQIRMFDALMENGFVRTGVVWGDTPRLFIQMDSYPTREAREAIDSLMSAFQDGHFTWELLDRGQSGTDRHEFRRLSGVRVDRSFIAQAAYALDQALGDLERLLTGRHYGPGPHPGTGTDQEVHGDGGRGSRVRQLADAVKERYEVIDNLAELPRMSGFILPDGVVVNLKGEEHQHSVQEINDELGLWKDDRFGRKVYDAALDGGFVRMSFVKGMLTNRPTFMFQLRPNPPQPVKDTIRDLFAIHGEDSKLVFDVLDVDSGRSLREFERASGVNVTRHYGPGHHPGTGTDQEVHGGNGSGSEHIQRFPDDTETYRDLIDRMSAMHREGKFALVTRDQETGEYLMITDRETAIDKLGEDIRNNPSESFYAFNDVEMFFHRQGGRHNVDFDAYELTDMRGFAEEAHQFGNEVATIHNHPPRLGEFMPPSPSDLEMSAAIHADELRVYTGDGTYKVRFEKFGNSAAFEIKMAFDDYDGENYHDRFPEFSSLYPEQQENYIRNTGKADELRQYQLDRLDHVADTLDWVSYEFQPLDD